VSSAPTGHSPLRVVRELRTEFPRVVLVLATGDLVASFGFSLFFPFLTIYLVETLGATAAEAGLVIAAYSLCSIVSGLVGGWLADRIGRRPVLIGSISATTLLVVSMALASEVWQVALIMLLLGCIDPAFLPAARAAVADTVEEERRPRAYGLLGVANALGWIAGPVIGAGLSTLGYPLLFAISGVLIGAYVVIAYLWLPETRPVTALEEAPGHDRPTSAASTGRVPSGGSTGTGANPTTATLPIPPKVTESQPIPRMIAADRARPPSHDGAAMESGRRRVFVALLPLLVLVYALTFLWVTTLPIYAAGTLGLATPVWGLLFGLNGLLIVLFQLRIATACERRSKPRVLAVAMTLYAGGLAIVSFLSPATAVVGLAATIATVTVGEMLTMPIVPALISDLSPVHRRGAYQGIAMATTGLGSALGPPIAGRVLDTTDGSALWLGAAALLGLTAIGLLALSRWTDRLRPTGGAEA
jgi:MFS family permease